MKTSKNLGITASCPGCKKVLCADVNFTGFGKITMKIKCPHCASAGKDVYSFLELGSKTYMNITKLVLLILFIGAMFLSLIAKSIIVAFILN